MTKLRGMVLGAFIADAIALGPHWMYNIEDIKKEFGTITGLTAPATNYHEGKTKGDFTHYGDQALMMFQYLKLQVTLEKESFYDYYSRYMKDFKGYKDHATKETIDNLERDIFEGSHSDELGGFTRYPAIIYLNSKDPIKGLEQVLLQTSMTHNDELLLDRVNFLTKLIYRILKGDKPSEAINDLKKNVRTTIYKDIEKAKSLLDYPTGQAIKKLGQSCGSEYAFPAVMYFVLKYEDHFEDALIENIMAGGDSAARGMVIGGILGAYHGDDKIPVTWLASMNQFKTIENLMMT